MIFAEQDGKCLRVRLAGEIDQCAAERLRSCIEASIRKNASAQVLMLDFSQVSFMDSSGVGLIIGRYKTMLSRGGRVTAYGMRPNVEKLFRMAGLHRIIAVDGGNKGEEKCE